MEWVFYDVSCSSNFYDLAAIHYCYSVSHVFYDVNVVADEQVTQLPLVLYPSE